MLKYLRMKWEIVRIGIRIVQWRGGIGRVATRQSYCSWVMSLGDSSPNLWVYLKFLDVKCF